MALDALIQRKESSWIQQLLAAPYTTLAKQLYAQRQHYLKSSQLFQKISNTTSVVCVSDTHNTKPSLPHGDVLVHAGDLTQNGTVEELQEQLDWLNAQGHECKIVIAGNHDTILDSAYTPNHEDPTRTQQSIRWGSIIYLRDSAANVMLANGRRLLMFGTPWTQRHGDWAFQYAKGIDVFSERVPPDTDLLITHSPPKNHLDVAGWGDVHLLDELWRTKPRMHVFGHIHAGAGQDILVYDLFEQLYERVCSRSAGVIALLQMTLLLLLMLVGISSTSTSKTILVNASVVGGLLDKSCHNVQVVSL